MKTGKGIQRHRNILVRETEIKTVAVKVGV